MDTKRGKAQAEQEGTDTSEASPGQFGRKYLVPYALYMAHGFVSPYLAYRKRSDGSEIGTFFGYEDLQLLFESLEYMFEHDRSASRGEMNTRKLLIFEHQTPLGEAPAHRLFDLVQVHSTSDIPRNYKDYQLSGLEGLDPQQIVQTYAVSGDNNGRLQVQATPQPHWKNPPPKR